APATSPPEPATRPIAWAATTRTPPIKNSARLTRKAPSSARVNITVSLNLSVMDFPLHRQPADGHQRTDDEDRYHVPHDQRNEGARRVDAGDSAGDVDRRGSGRGGALGGGEDQDRHGGGNR